MTTKEKYLEQKREVKNIARNVGRKKINALEAALQIDKTIRGITGVTYKTGKVLTIRNHSNKFSIDERILGKVASELAVIGYWRAEQNGSKEPGEVHIGKGCSTKHYKEGFRNYQQQVLQAYNTAERRCA